MNTHKYSLDSTVKLVIRILIAVGLFLIVRNLAGVLLPFVVGWFLAYLIYPLVCFVQYKLRVRSRIVSIVLSLLFIVGVLVGACFLILPIVYNEFIKIVPILTDYLARLSENPFINDVIINNMKTYFDSFDYDRLISLDTLNVVMGKLLPPFWGLLSNVWKLLLAVFSVFIVFLYMIFILSEYEKLNASLIKIFPVKYRRFTSELQGELSNAMNQYFRGQFIICLIEGTLYCIGFSIIGLPMAIAMGLLIGILSIVPYLHTFGFVPVIFFAVAGSIETGGNIWLMLLGVLIVFAVIQVTTDALIVPKIMGRKMGLSPAIILLSLSIFGVLFGFLGLIIALPVTTIAISYYKRFVIGNETIADDDTVTTTMEPLPDSSPN